MSTRPMPDLVLQLLRAAQDLGLDGDVERGGRLVGDQMSGFIASAIAIMMRWRWPPENWWGYLSSAALGVGDADAAHQVERHGSAASARERAVDDA